MRAWPPIPDDVIAFMGVPPAGDDDAAGLVLATDAAADYVAERYLPAPLPAEIPSRIFMATVILAARLYQRRSSVLGVASFGDMGVSMVVRADPDVRMLLASAPAIG